MKIYISGPINGTDDYMQRFAKATEKLVNEGFIPINPAAVNSMLPKETTYEEYMSMSLTMLDICEGIYMLKDWEDSKGANREYGYALAKGVPQAAIGATEKLGKMQRGMNKTSRQKPFQNAVFQDYNRAFTMRQAGMQAAQRSQYNLQQAIMGNEAQYLK